MAAAAAVAVAAAAAEEAWWGHLPPLAEPSAAPANLARQCTLPSAAHMASSPRPSITLRFGDVSVPTGTICLKQIMGRNSHSDWSLVKYWLGIIPLEITLT